jgi:hypothetical protein
MPNEKFLKARCKPLAYMLLRMGHGGSEK